MNAPTFTQENLLFTVLTPLGKDRLLFKSLQGEEALSGLFHFQVEMLSHASDLPFEDILGKNLTVIVEWVSNQLSVKNAPCSLISSQKLLGSNR